MQKQLEKQREINLKAEQKYKDWLQKKNQEKKEKEQKERVMCVFSTFHFLTFSYYRKVF